MGIQTDGVRTIPLGDGSIIEVPHLAPFDPVLELYTGVAQVVIRVYYDLNDEVMFVTEAFFKSFGRDFDFLVDTYQQGLMRYYKQESGLEKKRTLMHLSRDFCEKYEEMGWHYLKAFGKGTSSLFLGVVQFRDGRPFRECVTTGTVPDFPDITKFGHLNPRVSFIAYPTEWGMGEGFRIPSAA